MVDKLVFYSRLYYNRFSYLGTWDTSLLVISILSFFYPWLWSLLFLDVIQKNKEMREIINSVNYNGI